MKTAKFEKIAAISAGKNRSRMSSEELFRLYTAEDMNKALVSGESDGLTTVLINTLNLKSAPLTEIGKSKSIPATYLKCELIRKDLIDIWYLIYQLNEGSYIRKEISKLKQGTEALIKKINISDVSQLDIPYVPIEQQKKIGKLYRDGVRYQYLLKHQADITHRAIMKILENNADDE